jgi:hypothetical protein
MPEFLNNSDFQVLLGHMNPQNSVNEQNDPIAQSIRPLLPPVRRIIIHQTLENHLISLETQYLHFVNTTCHKHISLVFFAN